MVQIVPQQDLGELLGMSLTQGFSQGIAEKQIQFQEAQKQQKQLQDNLGKLTSNLGSFLRDTGRKEYGMEERDTIRNLASEFVNQGIPNFQAINQATQIFENPEQYGLSETIFGKEVPKKFTGKGKKPSALLADEPRRFTDDLKKLFGFGKEESQQEKQARQKAKKAKSLDEFTRSELFYLKPEDIQNLPEDEQDKFFTLLPSLVQESALSSQAAALPFVGRGLEERFAEQRGIPERAPPIADISRILSELPFISPAIGEGGILSQTLRGAGLFGGGAAAEEAVRTLGTDKPADLEKIGIDTLIGAAFPWAELAVSKLGSKLKNATKALMRSDEVTASEAAKTLTQDALKEGVDLGKVAANDVEEVGKLEKYLGRIEKVEAPTRKEVKPSRIAREVPKPKRPIKEEGKLFEKQVKMFDKLEGEIAKDAEKMEKLAARTKLPSTIAKEHNLKKVASSVLPEMESSYNSAVRNRARLADEFAIFKGTSNEEARFRALLREATEKEKEAGEVLKQTIFQSETGKVRPRSSQLNKQVEEAVEKLTKDVKDPSKKIDELIKRYNPERIKEGQRLLKKKKLPVDIYDDTYSKVTREYLKQYEKRAKELKEILSDPKSLISMNTQHVRTLHKELEAVNRALDRDAANLIIHQRDIGLREIARRKGVKERVLKLKPKEIPESMKPTQKKLLDSMRRGEKLSKIVKLPDTKNLEKAGAAAGMTKQETSSLKDTLNEIKGLDKKKFKDVESARKHLKSKINELLTPLKNQVAAGFVLGLLDPIFKELTGKKIPGKLKTIGLVGIGVGTRQASRRPILALTAYITDEFAKSYLVNSEAEKLSELSGTDFIKSVQELKKSKKFTAAQKKEILEKRRELRKTA